MLCNTIWFFTNSPVLVFLHDFEAFSVLPLILVGLGQLSCCYIFFCISLEVYLELYTFYPGWSGRTHWNFLAHQRTASITMFFHEILVFFYSKFSRFCLSSRLALWIRLPFVFHFVLHLVLRSLFLFIFFQILSYNIYIGNHWWLQCEIDVIFPSISYLQFMFMFLFLLPVTSPRLQIFSNIFVLAWETTSMYTSVALSSMGLKVASFNCFVQWYFSLQPQEFCPWHALTSQKPCNIWLSCNTLGRELK